MIRREKSMELQLLRIRLGKSLGLVFGFLKKKNYNFSEIHELTISLLKISVIFKNPHSCSLPFLQRPSIKISKEKVVCSNRKGFLLDGRFPSSVFHEEKKKKKT